MGTSWPVTFAATTGTDGGTDACAGAGALERCQTRPMAPRAATATSTTARTTSFLRIGRPSSMPQQPVANVVPVEPDIPLVVVPAIVDVPGQGVSETLGTGTPMGALTPEVPSSVAPSGIVLPLPMVPSPDPAAGVAAVPAAAPVVPEPQVLPVVEPGVA